MPQMFLKDPDEVKNFTVDFTNLLPTGDALTGSATVVADAGITVDASTVLSPNVTVQLSGGTAGSRYDVSVQVDSDAGDLETYDRSFTIVCEVL